MPLEPIIIFLGTEPLSIALKSASFRKGIFRYGSEHILSLYVDDLLLFISEPISTIPLIVNSLNSLLNRFGLFSGYKLNSSKSECFPVNSLALAIPNVCSPFKMSKNNSKYLGVNFGRQLSDLYQNNFPPLINKLKSDGITCI